MNEKIEDSGLRCLECDYNLTGLRAKRCPECGWVVDDELLRRLQAEPPSDAARGLTALLGAFVGLLIFLVVVIFGATPFWATLTGSVPVPWSATGLLMMLSVGFCGVFHLIISILCLIRRDTWPVFAPIIAWMCRCAGAIEIIGVSAFMLTAPATRRGPVELFMGLTFGSIPGTTLLVAAGVALTTRRTNIRRLRERVARRKPERPTGAPFGIMAEGQFTPERLLVTAAISENSPHTAVESLIEETWQSANAAARTGGQTLYDGRVARLVGCRVEDLNLNLTLGATTYREFIGTNLYNAAIVSQMGPGLLADALGTSAIAITADGRIVLGRRSERVSFHQGHLHTFGGLLDDCDRLDDGRYDVWAGIRREIREELGAGDDCISDLACVGLVRDTTILQPELLFDAHLTITSTELGRRFDATGDEEHTRLEACDDLPESIVPFIQRSTPMTPVAMAALLMHGKNSWGADWFEGACYVLFGDLPIKWSSTTSTNVQTP